MATIESFPASPPVRRLQRGETLSTGPWQIHEGYVRALTWDEDGELITLALWGPGDCLPAEVIEVHPYVLEALTPCCLRIVPHDPGVSAAASAGLRGEVLLSIVGCRRVSSRLLKLLLWIGARFGSPTRNGWQVDLPLSHQTLAELIGSTRATITRLLGQLEQEGRLQRGLGQSLVITHDSLSPCA